MRMQARFLPLSALGAAALGLAGCVTDAALREAASQRPALPIVTPPAQPAAPSETELVVRGVAAARRGDFAAAAQGLGGVMPTERRSRVAAGIAQKLAETEAEAAANFAAALPPGAAQEAALDLAAEALARRDPGAAVRWVAGLAEPATAAAARRIVFARQVASAPRVLMDRIRGLPPGPARDDASAAAAALWARRDPDGAVAWLGEQPADALKERLTASVAFELAQKTPGRAIALAEGLPAGRDRWLLLSAIAQTWVAVDARAATAWARGLPAGEAREAALAGVTTGLGIPTSRRSVREPGGSRIRIRGGGLASPDAVPGDSPAFAAWLATQAPGLTREQAVQEYVRQRGLLEPMAVGQWLSSLPPGPGRDQATEIYFEGLLNHSPAEAAQWLRNQAGPDARPEWTDRALERWLLTDPARAEAWLRESSLSPAQKEELLRRAGR